MLAAAMVVAVLTVTVAVAQIGAAVLARHGAQAAADLAALAAASAVPAGSAEACERARDVAAAMGASVTACAVTGPDVTVQVSVRAGLGVGEARAAARAGPV